MVKGRVMLPVHWGLFNLAFHGWTEPVERVLAAAEKTGVTVVVPKPGESIEVPARPAVPVSERRWWPELAWQSAEQDPIISTKMD
jgi:L-ascorbate metabolism protein UlaG (beta-lactamase superfamily)